MTYIKPHLQRKPEHMKMSFVQFIRLVEYAKSLAFLTRMSSKFNKTDD